jgi:hypothetical protein
MLGVPSIVFPIALAVVGQAAQPLTPKERFDSLVKEYTVAEGKWTERYRSDDTPAAREESLLRYRDWPAWAFMPRFMELADKNPKDAAGVDALMWIVDQGQAIGLNDKDYYPLLERALEQLGRAQLLDNRPVPRPRWVMRHPSPATERFLRNILATHKSREIRGRACLYLGELLVSRASLARNPWFDLETKTPFQTYLALKIHPTVLQYIRETDQQAAAVEGELMLARAISEFGDVEWDGAKGKGAGQGRARTVGDMARSELDEIRRAPAGKQGEP